MKPRRLVLAQNGLRPSSRKSICNSTIWFRRHKNVTNVHVTILLVPVWIPRLPIFFLPKRNWDGSCGYLPYRICYNDHVICSNLQSCQISSESDLQSKLASKCPNKRGTPTKEVRLQQFICLSSFFCLLFSFFSLYHTVRDKYVWNFASRSQICLRVPNLPEFIIKSYCLLLAVPRDLPNCKKHSEENNLHEREYDIRKDLIFRTVLTKNVMQSCFETKLSGKMQWTCCAQRNV